MNENITNNNLRKNIPSIFPLFSKPIFYKKLDPIPEDILRSYLDIQLVNTKDGSGFVSKNDKILNEEKFKSLRDILQKEIDFYVYRVLNISDKIKFKITNSWIMLHTEPSHKAQAHVHGGSVLSGCFYLKAPPKSGNINFIHYEGAHASKALPFPFYFNFTKKNIYNSSGWTFEVQNNLLLIFPSDLPHSTESNISGEARYCLAFDIIPEGEFGSGSKKIKIICE